YKLTGFDLASVDTRLMAHGQRAYYGFWIEKENESAYAKLPFYEMPSTGISYRGTSFGALVQEAPFVSLLNLSGYYAPTYMPLDFIKAQLAVDEIATKEVKKVLIYGLGNHHILREIDDALRHKNQNYHIDILDNFSLFKNQDFLNNVASENNVNWDYLTNVSLHIRDAFEFTFNSRENYDLIVWNLTSPNHPSSGALYTKEFIHEVSERLAPHGIFVGNFTGNMYYDCPQVNAFAASYWLDFESHLTATVSYKENLAPASSGVMKLHAEDCKNQPVATLNSWLQERSFDDRIIKQNNLFEPGVLSQTKLHKASTFNQHLNDPGSHDSALLVNVNAESVYGERFIQEEQWQDSFIFNNKGSLRSNMRYNALGNRLFASDSILLNLFPDLSVDTSSLSDEEKVYVQAYQSRRLDLNFANNTKSNVSIILSPEYFSASARSFEFIHLGENHSMLEKQEARRVQEMFSMNMTTNEIAKSEKESIYIITSNQQALEQLKHSSNRKTGYIYVSPAVKESIARELSYVGRTTAWRNTIGCEQDAGQQDVLENFYQWLTPNRVRRLSSSGKIEILKWVPAGYFEDGKAYMPKELKNTCFNLEKL
ncbi:MAG: hypothetical protein HKM24_00945, partial [Gammaproteobacteria bacterium]|nr:hypothetical protein [Gammaproteobacteria bacterium]